MVSTQNRTDKYTQLLHEVISANICHNLPQTSPLRDEGSLKSSALTDEKRVVERKAVTAFLLVFPE